MIIKFFSLFLLLPFAGISFAQGFSFDDNTAFVDGKPVFKVERIKNPVNYGFKDYSIVSMTGEKLIFLQFQEFNDPANGTQNPRTIYLEITFWGTGNKAEVRSYMKPEKVAEMIVLANLVKDGAVDPTAENQFVMTTGRKFSQRRAELNQPAPQTIIIQQPAAQPQPKVQINIGTPR